MTSLPEPRLEESAPCPYCGAVAEPEQDGDAIYFACSGCDGVFGYRKADSGAFCAAGLPVVDTGPAPVFIATTIFRRPSE